MSRDKYEIGAFTQQEKRRSMWTCQEVLGSLINLIGSDEFPDVEEIIERHSGEDPMNDFFLIAGKVNEFCGELCVRECYASEFGLCPFVLAAESGAELEPEDIIDFVFSPRTNETKLGMEAWAAMSK